MLAGLATAIEDVEIGTAVLLPALRNPVLLAQQLATIDQLSEGRLIVGAGIAADAPPVHAEFAAAGVPFARRVGRFMESFRLMRALWTGEPVSWFGFGQSSQSASFLSILTMDSWFLKPLSSAIRITQSPFPATTVSPA